MDWLKIDDWWEMLIWAVAIVAIVWRVLRSIDRRKGPIKVPGVEIGAEGSVQAPTNETEHALLKGELAEVKAWMEKIQALLEPVVVRVNSTDESLGALIANAAIVQKFVRRQLGRVREGDKINGDLDEADEEIKRAKEIYRKGRLIT